MAAAAATGARHCRLQAHLQDRTLCCVQMEAEVDAPGDIMYDLLADPTQHARIFDAIESASSQLLEERGPVRTWQLDYRARWRFWKVSGVCDNRLVMETNSDLGTVTFRLREPGFLKVYEGKWTITPSRRPQHPAASTPGGGGSDTSSTSEDGGASTRRSSGSGSGFFGLQSLSLPGSGSGSSSSAGGSPRWPAASAEPAGSPPAGGGALRSHPLVDIHQHVQESLHNGSSDGDDLAIRAAPFASLSAPPPSKVAAGAPLPLPPPQQVGPTRVTVEKRMCPRMAPPYPLNHTLKGQASTQVTDMLRGLLAAATVAAAARQKQQQEGVAAAAAEVLGGSSSPAAVPSSASSSWAVVSEQ